MTVGKKTRNITRRTPLETVLIIEDNPYDQEVIERGIHYANPDVHVKVKENVGSAITWLASCDLTREQTGDHTCKPELIILDIGLPGLYDGEVFIEELRKDSVYQSVPVVVLSNCQNPEIIQTCYRQGGDAFFHKPSERKLFETMVSSIIQYWNEVIELN